MPYQKSSSSKNNAPPLRVSSRELHWKPIKPHRTVMILERDSLLREIYKQKLEEHNWLVLSSVDSVSDLFHQYLQFAEKPGLLLLDYNIDYYPDLFLSLRKILLVYPSQYFLFVSSDRRLLTETTYLPPLFREVPVVLKSTHTVEDLVHDLDFLPDYGYPISKYFGDRCDG